MSTVSERLREGTSVNTRSRQRRIAMMLVTSLAVPLSILTAAPASADLAVGGDNPKIEPKVRHQIAQRGTTGFWVVLDSEPDLSGAERLKDKTAKARFVHTAKTRHAVKSQTGLRALLDRRHAKYNSFWIDNSLFVTGDSGLLAEIAARPEVAAVEADEPVALPDPLPGASEPSVNAVEWNIDRVNAPQVWSGLGVRGEGIVVANIDTGVKHDHPALASQYRGRDVNGAVNHNYNWYDPTAACSVGTPCDNHGHGSHTMGTMIGDDGAGNQIGVAPGAKWIAAKGCPSSYCSRDAILASGQWLVAPTDLAGQNPRPDLAPDVVNNSWGELAYDTWYAETVRSWIAAGIFPAFANGNNGPGCVTSATPGTYAASYSTGAFDINNAIAGFSGRGTGENGEVKPNIAAPGVNVRSSVPSGYTTYSGTSMASPHTAGAVALVWSSSPTVRGDVAATREILDDTATDADDTSCGGTPDDNNVFGEGRLDAYAAVRAAPHGALGTLTGRVTTSDGSPLADARVTVTGPMVRTRSTATDGSYSFDPITVGDYTVSVSKFGYLTATATVSITQGQTSLRNFTLAPAPTATLSGTVRLSSGEAAVAATVRVLNAPAGTVTDAQGRYQMTLPHGDHQVEVTSGNRCAITTTEPVPITGATQRDFTLSLRTDPFGYTCRTASLPYTPGSNRLSLTGGDVLAEINLPFWMRLYGTEYRKATIDTNGVLCFAQCPGSVLGNRAVPWNGTPNGAIFPFWDNLVVDDMAGVYTGTTGTMPNRTFIVEWRNVAFFTDGTLRVSFEVMLHENGQITLQYADIGGALLEAGVYATIGMEDATGTVGYQYSYNEPVVANGRGITFRAG
jgi:subtilisin family serine protease